jgi:hypothetical protein
MMTCSTRFSMQDCLAHAVLVRDAWIRAAIARCGS